MPLGASTFCSTAAPPEEAAREPAHEAAASARQAWMGQGRGLDSCGTHEQVRTPGPAREASSAHGHVSGGKRQGLEAMLVLWGGRRAAYSENIHGCTSRLVHMVRIVPREIVRWSR
jgi:hypothetical protein